MNPLWEKSLRYRAQKEMILLIHQNDGKLSINEIKSILHKSVNATTNVIYRLRECGILDYYKNKENGRYFVASLTEDFRNYLREYHPEIEPVENLTDLTSSISKEYETANQMSESEESISSATDTNLELREYYIKAIELLKLPNYMSLLMNYSLKEAILLSFFIICYLENKEFNPRDIAMLFEISEIEVSFVYRKTLLMLKDRLNEIIDGLLNDTPEAIQPADNILNVKNTSD